MENYSEELKNFLYDKTRFINDNNIEQIKIKNSIKDTSIISIIEKFIEIEIASTSPKNCIIFYLEELTQNDSLRKELLENINNKFIKNNIKAKEISEINFVLIYNISDENFINDNYDKLKEYFEDYLSQIKESLEFEEIKRKIMENIALEELEEEERKQRFILPSINSCDIINVSENEVIINVPLFDENEILDKNKYIVKDCLDKYGNTQIEYVIYLYNREKTNYDKC